MAKVAVLCFLLTVFILSTVTLSYELYDPVKTISEPSSFQTCNTFSDQHSARRDCYQGKCWCTKSAANCSGSGLTYIPKLPRGIRFLNFSYNGVEDITDDYFANVTHLTAISLDGNNIKNVSAAAFAKFNKLRVLFFEHCYNVSHEVVRTMLGIPTLTCVDLRYGNMQNLRRTMFNRTQSLEQIFLPYNHIQTAHLDVFAQLPKLRQLIFDGNYISEFSSAKLHALEGLSLNDNGLMQFPDTCDPSYLSELSSVSDLSSTNSTSLSASSSFFPSLTYLNLQANKIRTLPAEVCLPKLQILNLCLNTMPELTKDMFNEARFPSLLSVYLQNMLPHIDHIHQFAFNHSGLQKISLMYNDIQFSLEEGYSALAFAGCPNLVELVISHNALSSLTDERFLQLFGHLHKLERLYIGGTDLSQITVRTFAHYPRLTILELYLNKVPDIPDGAFSHNLQLKDLRLNANRISTITEGTFSKESRDVFSHLDLSNNPYSCDCKLRWFSDWLRSNYSAFIYPWSEYNCTDGVVRSPVAAFHVADQACVVTRTASIIIIATCTIIISAGTTFIILYCCRWELHLLCYDAGRGQSAARRQRLETGNFKYDVFVSYASEDRDQRWVRTHLMPWLEKQGIRPCIHERDFVPGKNIVENIVDCVQSSKKVIMVFSRHFVRSKWCQYELNFCLHHVIEHDDALITVCIDDVVSRELTSSMVAVMKLNTYIQWEEHDDAKASFWGRLMIAFQEIVPCIVRKKAKKAKKARKRSRKLVTKSTARKSYGSVDISKSTGTVHMLE